MTRGRFAPRAILFHASGVKASRRDESPRTHHAHAPSLASFIPEGWEPIAPGRAKHAPGDNAHHCEHAPRQGCEGSRSFNPSGAHLETSPACIGVATSSSPFRSLSQGDEDIAAPNPFQKGPGSRCAQREGTPGIIIDKTVEPADAG
jgi:hypothetical protein